MYVTNRICINICTHKWTCTDCVREPASHQNFSRYV